MTSRSNLGNFKLFTALAQVFIACTATLSIAQPATAPSAIVMASTTSTEQSGLFAYLLPEFKKATGVDVMVAAEVTNQMPTLQITFRQNGRNCYMKSVIELARNMTKEANKVEQNVLSAYLPPNN